MEIEHWHEYNAATDPKTKRKLLERIVRDNEKFIVANVTRLMRRGLTSPLSSIASSPLEDLVQAGRMGYTHALEKFNPKVGAFPPYAKHWIRHYVQQAAINETTIRKPKDSGLPYGVLQQIEKIRAQGREPTAEELGITEERYRSWRTEPFVMSYQQEFRTVSKAGAGSGVGRESEIESYSGEFMPDRDGLNPEELLGLKDIHASIDRLPEDERKVIRLMFFTDKNVSEILREMGMSCSTLYEVRDAALARLRLEV